MSEQTHERILGADLGSTTLKCQGRTDSEICWNQDSVPAKIFCNRPRACHPQTRAAKSGTHCLRAGARYTRRVLWTNLSTLSSTFEARVKLSCAVLTATVTTAKARGRLPVTPQTGPSIEHHVRHVDRLDHRDRSLDDMNNLPRDPRITSNTTRLPSSSPPRSRSFRLPPANRHESGWIPTFSTAVRVQLELPGGLRRSEATFPSLVSRRLSDPSHIM